MNKKPFILFVIFSLINFNSSAQHWNNKSNQKAGQPSDKAKERLTDTGVTINQAGGKGSFKQMAIDSFGTKIGRTYYDVQTPGSAGNRIIRHADGTISAVWNEVCNPNTAASGSPSLGIGYNYNNGTTWSHGQSATALGVFLGTCNEPAGTNGPNFGIASKRVSSPEIISVPNNQELIFTGSSNGINLTSRPVKGTGGMAGWSTTTDLPFTQNILGTGNYGNGPRAASDGLNVHLIYSVTKNSAPEPVIDGVANPFVYSRSVDGGLTWDRQNIILPDLNGVVAGNNASYTNDNYRSIGANNYAIAARGNTIAVVAGSHGDPWTLWKSVDNGTTWARRIIKTTSSADTIILAADSAVYTNDNAHSLIIDSNGMVHVFGGMVLSGIDVKARPAAAGSGSYFRASGFAYPPTDYPNYGLVYWNESMPATTNSIFDLKIASIEDTKGPSDPFNWVASGIGPPAKQFPYGGIGIVSMPSAAIDGQNNIYVVYAGVVEGTSNNGTPTGQPYRDLYVMKRFSVNGSWAKPFNIARRLRLFPNNIGSSTAENSIESVFPSMAKTVGPDNALHIVFQQDLEPGTSIGPDADTEAENDIIYYKLHRFNSLTSTHEADKNLLQNFSAFPNPTTGKLSFALSLAQPTKVSITIKNLLGQEVAAIERTKLETGENQLDADVSQLANGVYLYTVSSESFSITKKLVKQ